MAWHMANSDNGFMGKETHDVARKKGNDWGLHDMHGNVYEWCEDAYDSYPEQMVQDPVHAGNRADDRILRGGSFWSYAASCRSANRFKSYPMLMDKSFGVRIAAVPVL